MRNPFLIALIHPVNLAMLALAVAAGLCAAWWLFPLGLVVWGLMVLRVARDPGLRISHEVESRSAIAPRFQPKFDRLQRLQVSFFNNLNSVDNSAKGILEPIQDEVNQLIDETYQLCQRVSALENYRLVSQAKEDLDLEWVGLSQKAAAATDPKIQTNYHQSLAALETRIAKRKQVESFLNRVDAQLTSLANTLDTILAEILQLQAVGADELRKQQKQIIGRLREEDRELTTFEGQSAMQLAE
jgi:hypothetical protein